MTSHASQTVEISWDSTVFVSDIGQLPEELLHILQYGSNLEFLERLSALALVPRYTGAVFTHFEQIALDICARWDKQDFPLAAAAFGRILDILPHLSEVAQRVLERLYGDVVPAVKDYDYHQNTDGLREHLLALYRLLEFDNARFVKFVRPARLPSHLLHADHSVRLLTTRILCQYLHASDAVFEKMKKKHVSKDKTVAAWEVGTINYLFLTLWEEKRWRDLRTQQKSGKEASSQQRLGHSRILTGDDLHQSIALAGGVLLLRSSMSDSTSSRDTQRLVPTITTSENMHAIASALHDTSPLLVTGFPGCGKTSLVKQLAAQVGKSSNMISLHLNEQSDAKLLIGTYTTGAEAGSFTWQPGVLTTAVQEGRWVLIEDLDRAPNEIISTLLPLIERRELHIPSRGEKLQAAAGFKIIATMRSTTSLEGQTVTPGVQRLLGRRLWRHVPLRTPSLSELHDILEERHPVLASYVPKLMAVYERLASEESSTSSRRGTSQMRMRARPSSPRELFKWAARIERTLYAEGVRTGKEAIRESAIDAIFLDACDCFVSHLEDQGLRGVLASMIAEELHMDSRRRDHLLCSRQVVVRRLPAQSRSSEESLSVGRASVPIVPTYKRQQKQSSATFALNDHSRRILEQVSVSVRQHEPLLLVGETGIGKTAAIQHLSYLVARKLIAINLSQQSEAGDLLGGFKPVNIRSIAIPLKDEFDALFGEALSRKKNAEFLSRLATSIRKGKWKLAVSLWRAALRTVANAANSEKSTANEDSEQNGGQRVKRRKTSRASSADTFAMCTAFSQKLDAFEHQVSGPSNAFRFAFAEGKLVEAVRLGHWVLLDEINLATSDTLESISDLLESGPDARPFLILTESGQVERIEAHADFRLFAAMNPASDVGKKDLPMGIRSRFTEIYVHSPDRDGGSLETIVHAYLERCIQTDKDRQLPSVVTATYQDIQAAVQSDGLVDGSGERPHFSLRTLTRTLTHAVSNIERCSLKRALYEGFCMSFFTSLDTVSETKMQNLVQSRLFGESKARSAHLMKPLRPPQQADHFVEVTLHIASVSKSVPTMEELHWLPKGQDVVQNPSHYIITPYIARNLKNLIRATSTRKHPVLIQGPTSAGKTSMVEYLAQRSGNRFIRINNHEHTDLQEYLGTYVSTADGQLVFQEGALVQAVRNGYWVVLDELNLAPTDVLEALNRLLDDNRELFIPETQEVVKPHPDFMLFATQNPAGPYGGRKALSRAFRNRFVELHFDDIPVEELNIILARRSSLPESWCKLVIEVYKRLARLRQEQRLFEQDSFATLRDLFRWAFRGADSLEQLAANGYMLLGEKVRKAEERTSVKEVIEQVMGRKGVQVRIDDAGLYNEATCSEMRAYGEVADGVIWTKPMRRLYTLVAHAIRNREPVLLVGETGCGKTTVCQIIAAALHTNLRIVNAHQNTETGDLIGSQRPIRNRSALEDKIRGELHDWSAASGGKLDTAQPIEQLLVDFDAVLQAQPDTVPAEMAARVLAKRHRAKALFEWVDGSLVQAMRSGEFFLLDEISLADDSVLERMNSVLDPSRTVLLAEKGGSDSLVKAAEGFQFLATMNPGGDFGKKELSPALRNRFTEIWVPPLTDVEDVLEIAEAKLSADAQQHAKAIVGFSKWFVDRQNPSKATAISIRDVLAWIEFINGSALDTASAVVHGAAMVFIDTLGANPSALTATHATGLQEDRAMCLSRLEELTGLPAQAIYHRSAGFHHEAGSFVVGPFVMAVSPEASINTGFNFEAPTAQQNALRLARALQIRKPVLLEGNPGVGKTSIVMAIAKAIGKPLVRINLSEQTDLMDLFGSDVPTEGAAAGNFSWRDAPFLQAMKSGHWVLLDEMNLASQSVLEGLNSCLDHRAEVYIADLDQTFTRHPDFKLFAAQNPHHQGGGRKGLPTSFVNRFTVVYADVYQQDDLYHICSHLFPGSDNIRVVRQAINCVTDLDKQVDTERRFGVHGGPWEFNLRDIVRWLTLITSQVGLLPAGSMRDFFNILFTQRFRLSNDIYKADCHFDAHDSGQRDESLTDDFAEAGQLVMQTVSISPTTCQVGVALLAREPLLSRTRAPRSIDITKRLATVESVMLCVQHNWPVILVGASGVGKTSILQCVAAMMGADLETFPLNADIDASDLIGGYEQADPSREKQAFAQALRSFCAENAALIHLDDTGSRTQDAVEPLFSILYEVQGGPLVHERCHRISALLKQYRASHNSEHIEHLIVRCDQVAHATGLMELARFEWTDGVLIKALNEGRWLVLDNANLCSSSVLDRLNSLLEPNGTLIVSEHCNEDGTPKIITPHPNFRIFMTMDPSYGELSRAMRNRAVELFMAPLKKEHLAQSRAAISTESSMMTLHQLVELSQADLTGRVMHIASEAITLADMHLLPDFVAEVERGLITGPSQPTIAAISRRHARLQSLDTRYLSGIECLYSKILGKLHTKPDFFQAQPVDCLGNTQVLRYSECTSTTVSLQRFGAVQEVYLNVAMMYEALDEARDRSMDSNSTTRLARSLASATLQAARKDSTIHAGHFLCNTAAIFLQWAQQQRVSAEAEQHLGNTFDSTVPHPSSDSHQLALAFIKDMMRFWWDLYELTNSHDFDESVFQTYLLLGEDRLHHHEPIASLKDNVLGKIRNELQRMQSKASMTSGLSMERLWQMYRPPVPRNERSLQALQALRQLATDFAQNMWSVRAPLDVSAALQHSFERAMDTVVQHDIDVDPLLQGIKTTLDQLRSRDSGDELVTPYLLPVFQNLFTLNGLMRPYSDRESNTHSRLLACKGPMLVLSDGSSETPASSLATLAQVGEAPSGAESDDSFLDHTHLILLRKLDKVDNVELQRLGLLRTEMNSIGQQIGNSPDLLNRDICDVITTRLQVEMRRVLAAHGIEASDGNGLHSRDHLPMTVRGRAAGIIERLANANSAPGAGGDSAWSQTGWSLVQFALDCLWLYVPDQPYDPAIRGRVKRALHKKHSSQLLHRIESLQTLEELRSSLASPLRRKAVQVELSELERRKLAEPAESVEVVRPQVSNLGEIQAEFANVLRLRSQIEKEGGSIEQNGPPSLTLISTISTLSTRLAERYPAYTDLVEPVVYFLGCLRTGLSLLRRAHVSAGQPGPLWPFDANNELQRVPLSDLTIADVRKYWFEHAGARFEGIDSHVLKLKASIEPPTTWSLNTLDVLRNEFDRLHGHWALRLEKDRKANQAARSLYEYKGGRDDDDDALEAQFEELFPSFEENMGTTPSGEAQTAWNPRAAAVFAADVHANIFLSPQKSEAALEELISQVSSRVSQRLVNPELALEDFPSNEIARAGNHLPALYLLLRDKKHRLSTEAQLAKHQNVYTDRNLAELTKLLAIVHNTQDRFRAILEAWPEHASLHNVLAICKELRASRLSEPLMKIMPKVEQLHSAINEWQSVASREFSAAEHFEKVTELIISWRQLELTTWSKLLDLEDEKSADAAKDFWFLAYGSVCAQDVDGNVTELLTTLHDLMTQSTLGQYAQRLLMLRSLALQLQTMDKNMHRESQTSVALANFCSYFARHSSHVAEAISEGRRKLEKSVKEVLQLASWKDRNVEALKESAKTSHRRLFRIVKKYRELLSQPAAPILGKQLVAPVFSAVPAISDKVTVYPVDTAAIEMCRQNSDSWHARPQRFRDPSSTANLIKRKTLLGSAETAITSRVDDFVDSLEASVVQLQKATPAVLTEENSSTVKHLTTRKRRLFADTLKDLRQMGFKSNVSVDVLAQQQSLSVVLASLAPSPSILHMHKPNVCQEAEGFLFLTLDQMDKVRSAANDHHEDLSSNDAARSIAFAESVLGTCIAQRKVVVQHRRSARSMEGLLAQFDELWSSGKCNAHLMDAQVEDKSRTMQTKTTWLPTILRVGAKVITAQAELGALDFTNMIEGLHQWAAQLEAIRGEVQQLAQLPAYLVATSSLTLIEIVGRKRHEMASTLTDWQTTTPQAAVTLKHIHYWITCETDHSDGEVQLSTTTRTIAQFEQSQYEFLDVILGSVQDVEKQLLTLEPENEDKDWFVRNMASLGHALKAFRTDTVASSLRDMLDQLQQIGQGDRARLATACASLTVVLPILKQYHASVEYVLDQYGALHLSTCRAAYHLTKNFTHLAAEGFCKPAEQSNEKGGNIEKLESGTGLGEGEGAEDISKDIGSDEDLSELAQDEENKKKEGGMENQDDAVDIDDALEGAAGEDVDGEEVEEKEANDKDGDEEAQDMDSETGSIGGGEGGEAREGEETIDNETGEVDDLGPSTVDEKMWDEAGDESKQQKQADQAAKTASSDADAAADGETKPEDKEGDAEAVHGEGQDEGSDEGEMDSDMEDAADGGREEAMDPHVQEGEEGLELPEDMQLDGDKNKDIQMDNLSDDDHLDDLGDLPEEADRADRADEGEEVEEEAMDTDAPDTKSSEQQVDDVVEEEVAEDGEPGDATAQDDKGLPQAEDVADNTQPEQGAGGTASAINEDVDQAQDQDAVAQGAGPDSNEQQNMSASSAQRQSGKESEATQTSQGTAQDDGHAQPEPSTRDDADSQMIKKLGDILEKWHRQHREIQPGRAENENRPERQQEAVDMTNAQFEHLPDDDAKADTQALDVSNEEQARGLDDRMAEETTAKENMPVEHLPSQMQNEDMDDDEDVEMLDEVDDAAERSEQTDQQSKPQPQAFVGERHATPPRDPQARDPEQDPEDMDVPSSRSPTPDLDSDINAISLTTRPTSPSSTLDPSILWHRYTSSTASLSQTLTEQLRLILAPTLATKLRGDFRTGKRLNIKRIIPYIASSYKRDRIWMRRSVPSKRVYQVMLAIDDSGSMSESVDNTSPARTTNITTVGTGAGAGAGTTRADLAFSTLALLSTSLTALEVGSLSILGFGAEPFTAHPFSTPFSSSSGPNVLSQFTFAQQKTDVRALLQKAIEQFMEARTQQTSGGEELWQLMLIVGDGICEDHEGIRKQLLRAQEERILVVFVVVDQLQAPAQPAPTRSKRQQQARAQSQSQSILDLESVEFVAQRNEDGSEGEAKLMRRKYLDTFPFRYYLVVRDVRELPGVLATALRQWFAEVVER